MYSIKEIGDFFGGSHYIHEPACTIEHLLTDSRKLIIAETSLFFALKTQRDDGSKYIDELFNRGVRNFVVAVGTTVPYANVNVIEVANPLRALQQLAAWHRSHFDLPIIAITGSNGKTMVKEWLHQLLHTDHNIVRSPRSYNSQVGVPLSIWQINSKHTLGIFEAGISQPGEMDHLQQIIQPTLGVLTNIGEAHNEGFTELDQKVKEKLLLFKRVSQFVYCKDLQDQFQTYAIDASTISALPLTTYSWGTSKQADLAVNDSIAKGNTTLIRATITSTQSEATITIPFTDKASIENAITCWCVLLILGYEQAAIQAKMALLQPIEMRMQLKKGVNNCLIINDSYNNDLSSLELALDYLVQQSAGRQTTLVLSDIFQSGHTIAELAQSIILKVKNRQVKRLILIGPLFYNNQQMFTAEVEKNAVKLSVEFHFSTEAFLQHSVTGRFKDEVILLKGARVFGFEQIDRWLEEKVHQTVMEVNLNAMVDNLKAYQKLVQPGTLLMAMVKAFSYGSGSAEIASVLQYHKVDYLAVAYADEGVELRKAGIQMPIMVMSPDIMAFDVLIEHNLEPELYSPAILKAFLTYLQTSAIQQYPVHIKLDTGMHRLGFDEGQWPELLELLILNDNIVVKSVFSHLAASSEQTNDAFTLQQAALFEAACLKIQAVVKHPFIRHLSNTAAIFRFPKLQYDMVRLGIGLYGVETGGDNRLQLKTVATLKSTIAQIRNVKAGESIGYSRQSYLDHDATIATIRIGYADGLNRNLGNGVGKIYLKGQLAPITGNVCMDMIMADITHIPHVHEGDEVEIFGAHLPVTQIAAWSNTIPYEVLTGISQRVKRVYFEE